LHIGDARCCFAIQIFHVFFIFQSKKRKDRYEILTIFVSLSYVHLIEHMHLSAIPAPSLLQYLEYSPIPISLDDNCPYPRPVCGPEANLACAYPTHVLVEHTHLIGARWLRLRCRRVTTARRRWALGSNYYIDRSRLALYHSFLFFTFPPHLIHSPFSVTVRLCKGWR
jgi:hypothetical protein